tara:strand:+ start:176 stop:802 length:627 start_codon:yes stop_codon:yes gene_type:complete
MNELLAQAYGTYENINNNNGVEKTAEAALLDELQKVATAEGIDLNDFSEDDIVEILSEAVNGVEEVEKTASAEEVDAEQEKLAEADFLGRTMAHAFYDELTAIQGGVEKTASRNSDNFLKVAADETTDEDALAMDSYDFSDETFANAFEEAALARANEIIDYLDTGVEKQSSVAVDDEHLNIAVSERAGQLLDENGYDVEAIVAALNG